MYDELFVQDLSNAKSPYGDENETPSHSSYVPTDACNSSAADQPLATSESSDEDTEVGDAASEKNRPTLYGAHSMLYAAIVFYLRNKTWVVI